MDTPNPMDRVNRSASHSTDSTLVTTPSAAGPCAVLKMSTAQIALLGPIPMGTLSPWTLNSNWQTDKLCILSTWFPLVIIKPKPTSIKTSMATERLATRHRLMIFWDDGRIFGRYFGDLRTAEMYSTDHYQVLILMLWQLLRAGAASTTAFQIFMAARTLLQSSIPAFVYTHEDLREKYSVETQLKYQNNGRGR